MEVTPPSLTNPPSRFNRSSLVLLCLFLLATVWTSWKIGFQMGANQSANGSRLNENGGDLRLNVASFHAVDKKTGKRIPVTVTTPEQRVGENMPIIIMYEDTSPARVIWVDKKPGACKVSAPGYQSKSVEAKAYKGMSSFFETFEQIELESIGSR